MNTEYLYPPTTLVFFAASKKHYISLLFFLSISTTPKNTVASEEAIADEFSNWELVSSMAAKRFAHRFLPP